MKHEKDSEQLKKLIKTFENAEKNVGKEFQSSKTSAQLKINVDKRNKTNEFKLLNEVKNWAEKELPEAFQQGYESARKDDSVKGSIPQTTFYDFTQSVLPYIEIGSKVHESVSQYSASINKKIEELEHGEYVTIEKVKNTIIEEVGDMPFIKYANGAKMPLSKYAEMLARTSRIETANGGIVARCKDIKRDLVRYLALPNCCPHCQKFSNKVFSISGQDKRFPYLYGDKGPFREGYNITHPNCRCEIMPFIEELYTDELDDIIKSSNRLTNFDKNDKMFDNYNKAQARNRQANAELVEYTRLKHTLGKQFPYKTLGSFRRAKRQKSQTYRNITRRDYEESYGKFLTKDGKSSTVHPVSIKNLDKVFDDKTTSEVQLVLDKSSDNARQVWNEYSEYVQIDSISSKRAYFDRKTGKIMMNLEATKNDVRGSYTSLFHEAGHSIDYYAGIVKFGKANVSEYFQSKEFVHENTGKGYTLGEMVREEVEKYINDEEEFLKEQAVKNGGKRSDVLKGDAYVEIEKNFKDLTAEQNHALSDIFEGATNGKIRIGYGHLNKRGEGDYWEDKNSLTRETFAHFYSSYTSNKDSFKVLSDVFPKTTKLFDEIMEAIK